MKNIIYVLVLFLTIVSCGNSRKSVIEKQIDVYEAGIERISSVSNIKEFNLIRNEVKTEIEAIKNANKEELSDIRWNAFLKEPEAARQSDSLMAVIKRYGALCRNKKQQFKIK